MKNDGTTKNGGDSYESLVLRKWIEEEE